MNPIDPAQGDPTPGETHMRVSRNRQNVDLSAAAQRRALHEYAERNGYLVVREFVDEGESGHLSDQIQDGPPSDLSGPPTAEGR